MIHLHHVSKKMAGVVPALILLTIPAASEVLETDHFIIDYELTGPHAFHLTDDTDMNGHPDYIDSLAYFATVARAIIIDTLGFPAPVPLDDSSGKFTIKVRDLHTWDTTKGLEVGYCTTSADGRSGIYIENDFSLSALDCFTLDQCSLAEFVYSDTGWKNINAFIYPFPKLKETVFHELFHASQAVYLKNSPTSLRESAASWFQFGWTGYYSLPTSDAYFHNIGKGWFSNDSATQCGNFPFLLYAEEAVGRGFVRNLHEYRSSHIPQTPGDPYAEARSFHDFCGEYHYAEKELLKGFTEEIAAIIEQRDVEVLDKLRWVYSMQCLNLGDIPALDLRGEEKVAWRGEPFGMTVLKLPIRGWTFAEGSAIEMRVTGSEEWGYAVPVIETDSGRIVMQTVHFDPSHPLHLPLLQESRRLSLYIQHNWAGMEGEFELILPAEYPFRNLKPVSVYESKSSTKENSPAFDQNLETLWPEKSEVTSITIDFGEVQEIRQCVLYSSSNVFPEMAFTVSESVDGQQFTFETGKQCLGNIMILDMFCFARYLRLGKQGVYEVQEFEVLSSRLPVKTNIPLPAIAAKTPLVGTSGNRLVIYRQPDPEAVYRVFSLDGRIAAGFVHASGKPFISEPLSPGTYIVRLPGKTSGNSARVVMP